MLDSLFGNLDVFQKSMQGLTARQRVIAENVSNADTPRYKRLEVHYEQQLREAMHQDTTSELPLVTQDARHFRLGPHSDGGTISDVRPDMSQVTDESYRNDQNNVDIEMEMAKLAETNLRYNTLTTLSRGKFEGIKNVLREIR